MEGVGQVAQTTNGQKIQRSGQRSSANKQDLFPTSCLHHLPSSSQRLLLPDREIHDDGKLPNSANVSKQMMIPIKCVQACSDNNNENSNILHI